MGIKSSRSTTGTWTITGLIPGRPLYLVANTDVAAADSGFGYRVLTGANGGYSPNDTYVWSMHSDNTVLTASPSSAIVFPFLTEVVINVTYCTSGVLVRAYQ